MIKWLEARKQRKVDAVLKLLGSIDGPPIYATDIIKGSNGVLGKGSNGVLVRRSIYKLLSGMEESGLIRSYAEALGADDKRLPRRVYEMVKVSAH